MPALHIQGTATSLVMTLNDFFCIGWFLTVIMAESLMGDPGDVYQGGGTRTHGLRIDPPMANQRRLLDAPSLLRHEPARFLDFGTWVGLDSGGVERDVESHCAGNRSHHERGDRDARRRL